MSEERAQYCAGYQAPAVGLKAGLNQFQQQQRRASASEQPGAEHSEPGIDKRHEPRQPAPVGQSADIGATLQEVCGDLETAKAMLADAIAARRDLMDELAIARAGNEQLRELLTDVKRRAAEVYLIFKGENERMRAENDHLRRMLTPPYVEGID